MGTFDHIFGADDAPPKTSGTFDHIFGTEPKHIEEDRGFLGDVGSRLARGTVKAVEMTGRAGEQAGFDTGLKEWAEEAPGKYDILKPDIGEVEGEEGKIYSGIMSGIESIPMSAVPFATGAAGGAVGGVPGAVVGGLSGIGALFGLGTYNEKKEELDLKAPHLSEEERYTAARDYALIESGGEVVGDLIFLATGGVSTALGLGTAGRITTVTALKSMLKTTPKQVAKDLGKAYLGELATETGQAYFQSGIDEKAGLSDDRMSVLESLAEVAIPTAVMTLTFGLGTQAYSASQKKKIENDLNSMDSTTRINAKNTVLNNIEDPELSDFFNEYATNKIQSGDEIAIESISEEKFQRKAFSPVKSNHVTPPESILQASSVDEAIAALNDEIERPEREARKLVDYETQQAKSLEYNRLKNNEVKRAEVDAGRKALSSMISLSPEDMQEIMRPIEEAMLSGYEPTPPSIDPAAKMMQFGKQLPERVEPEPSTPISRHFGEMQGRFEKSERVTPTERRTDFTPEDLKPAISTMRRDMETGEVGQRYKKDPTTIDGKFVEEVGGVKTTNPLWIQQKTLKSYDKANGTDLADRVNKKYVKLIFDKVSSGKKLTLRQDEAWAYLQSAARDLENTHPEVIADKQYSEIESQGIDLSGPEEVVVADIDKGDKVVVMTPSGIPDILTHKGMDKEGNAILEDGQRLSVDDFEQIEVIGRKDAPGKQTIPEKITVSLGKPDQIKNMQEAGITEPQTQINQIIRDAVQQPLDVSKRFEEKGKTEQAEKFRKQAIEAGEKIKSADVEAGKIVDDILTPKPLETETVTEKKSIAEGQEVNVTPTDAMKKAENYKQAHVKLDGLDITVENPLGTTRSGKDRDGESWSQEMKADYGKIKGSLGFDKDHVDIFVKPGYKGGAEIVHIVNQVNKDGSFDEHKTVIGAKSESEAMKIYNSNYEKGWTGGKNVVSMPIDEFKEWVKSNEPQKGEAKKAQAKSVDVKEDAPNPVVDQKDIDLSDKVKPGKDSIADLPSVETVTEPSEKVTPAKREVKLSKKAKIFSDNPPQPKKSTAKDLINKSKVFLTPKGFSNLKINIVQSVSEIPKEFGVNGDRLQGFYVVGMGDIYIIADNVHSDEIWSKIVHEGTHSIVQSRGWGHLFGTKSESINRIIDDKLESGKLVWGDRDKKIWEESELKARGDGFTGYDIEIQSMKNFIDRHPENDKSLVSWGIAERMAINSGASRENMREESISYWLASGAGKGTSLWRKIVNAIRSWAVRVGIKTEITDKDIQSIAERNLLIFAKSDNYYTSKDSAGGHLSSKEFSKSPKTDTPEFKKWFGKSTVKEIDDTPKVLYHGTPEDFYVFKPSERRSKSPLSSLGNFFTEDRQEAQGYAGPGGEIISVYAKVKKPLVLNSWDIPSNSKEQVDKFREYAKEQGFDGIYIRDEGHYVVFKSEDIKSTANKGSFDPQNPDIRFSYADTISDMTDQDYLDNQKQNRNLKAEAKRNVSFVTGGIKKGADKYLGAISTRLANINPKIKAKIRKLDFDTNTLSSENIQKITPLMNKAKSNMSRNDFIDWDYARKNSDTPKINELIKTYKLEKEYSDYRKVLDELRNDAIDVGLEIGEIEEYAPRVLKDSEGFLTAIGKGKDWPVISKALKDRANTLGISVHGMTPEMKADIVSGIVLRGGYGLSGPASSKQRKLKKIPANLNQFYMHSDAALMQHIHSMTKNIESRRFFGRVPEKISATKNALHRTQKSLREELEKDNPDQERIDELTSNEIGYRNILEAYRYQRDYTDNIQSYVVDLINAGEINELQEKELVDILNARFHERGATGLVQAYKNFSYMDTMGSPISALTQIGDLAWAGYKYGLISTLKSAYKSVAGKSRMTKEDVGIERIAQEFADSDKLSNAVAKVFKVVGLEKMDSIGKESLLNSALDNFEKRAVKDSAKLKKEIGYIFEGETDSVIDDLANRRITGNVKLLVYSKLLDFQPAALSEMPEQYLKAGNGRLFYMLKSYTLKQFDVYRNEVYQKIKNGSKSEKIEGIKNLAALSMMLVLANAAADEAKDFVLGRETDLSDRVTDNILRLFGISKFVTWKARTEGAGSAMAKQILPPFKFVDSLYKDVVSAGDGKGLEVVGSVPVLGKLAYWHMGRGTSKRGDLWDGRLKKERKKLNAIKDRVEKNPDERAKHRKELKRLRVIERLQSRLNKIRSKANKLKGRVDSEKFTDRIIKLEDSRTVLIKKFLEG